MDRKISIITVAYNSEKTIEETLRSVLNQTYANIEYIIVDGGSTDSTMSIVREHERKFDGRLRWSSEPDQGIYDAINKGIRMATGDVIGLLHSDDLFGGQDTLQKINDRFDQADCDGIYGDLVFVNPNDISSV